MPEIRTTQKKKKFHVQSLVLMATLVAMEVVLSRLLSYSVWNMKIGFAFVPVVIAGIMMGPVRAAIVGAVADFVGAILFPIGAYFPGFTLTAALVGALCGLFLYKKQSFWNILIAVSIHQLILSLMLNTLWISVLYQMAYTPLLITRLMQCMVMIPVEILVIGLIVKTLGSCLLSAFNSRCNASRSSSRSGWQ